MKYTYECDFEIVAESEDNTESYWSDHYTLFSPDGKVVGFYWSFEDMENGMYEHANITLEPR